jgi:hypothetical protein
MTQLLAKAPEPQYIDSRRMTVRIQNEKKGKDRKLGFDLNLSNSREGRKALPALAHKAGLYVKETSLWSFLLLKALPG